METQPAAIDIINLLHQENKVLENCIRYLTFSKELEPDEIIKSKEKIEDIIKHDRTKKEKRKETKA